MADAFVNVPDLSSGKQIDNESVVIGADTRYRQRVNVMASALPTGAATAARQDSTIANLQALNSLVPTVYDYIELSYTGDNVTSVVYKLGGVAGAIVSTLTLAYSGLNLISVTKS